MIRKIVFLLVLLLAAFWVATLYVSRPLFTEKRGDLPALPAVADRNDALTFARSNESLLLVTRVDGQRVTAIDLTERFGPDATRDTLRFFEATGFDLLQQLDGPEVAVSMDELRVPLRLADTHVAAGTNFAEHADEVLLDDPPFLFPKLAAATPWNASIAWARRLDYEAELAAVPLAPITAPDNLPRYALLLANDVTDRLTLISQIDLDEPMGTTGFAAGKGQPGFLPVGPWLVIPREPDFYRNLEFRLYVNDELRQRFKSGDMILSIDDIARQAFRDRSLDFRRGDAVVGLLPDEGLSSTTLILTGTAGGVVFKPLNIWWQPAYLKAGDVVRVEASYLGVLHNAIVTDPK